MPRYWWHSFVKVLVTSWLCQGTGGTLLSRYWWQFDPSWYQWHLFVKVRATFIVQGLDVFLLVQRTGGNFIVKVLVAFNSIKLLVAIVGQGTSDVFALTRYWWHSDVKVLVSLALGQGTSGTSLSRYWWLYVPSLYWWHSFCQSTGGILLSGH